MASDRNQAKRNKDDTLAHDKASRLDRKPPSGLSCGIRRQLLITFGILTGSVSSVGAFLTGEPINFDTSASTTINTRLPSPTNQSDVAYRDHVRLDLQMPASGAVADFGEWLFQQGIALNFDQPMRGSGHSVLFYYYSGQDVRASRISLTIDEELAFVEILHLRSASRKEGIGLDFQLATPSAEGHLKWERVEPLQTEVTTLVDAEDLEQVRVRLPLVPSLDSAPWHVLIRLEPFFLNHP
jgi:hypothetical protein